MALGLTGLFDYQLVETMSEGKDFLVIFLYGIYEILIFFFFFFFLLFFSKISLLGQFCLLSFLDFPHMSQT